MLEVEYINLLAAWPVKQINDGWTKRQSNTALLAGCWLSTTGRSQIFSVLSYCHASPLPIFVYCPGPPLFWPSPPLLIISLSALLIVSSLPLLIASSSCQDPLFITFAHISFCSVGIFKAESSWLCRCQRLPVVDNIASFMWGSDSCWHPLSILLTLWGVDSVALAT